MLFFKPWEKKESEKEMSHTLKPVWLRDLPTQDESIIRGHRQLRLLSIYGIGGCSIIDLNEQQMSAWFDLAKGDSKDSAEMRLLFAKAIPKAYDAVIVKGKDCRDYFLTDHNQRVRSTKTKKSQRILCTAREGEVLDIIDRKRATLLMTNTRLLKSWIGKQLHRVALIGFNGRTIDFSDGCVEDAFIDLLPDARIGDHVIAHRNIVCEIV